MKKDELGDRMKTYYEGRHRFMLQRRTYTIIRIDGKAFHTFTRGLEKPFDEQLIEFMQFTAAKLCKEIQGCKLAYTQSDEISLVLTDFDEINTAAWFDGNLQKIASVSASIATAAFANEMNSFVSICEDNIEDTPFLEKSFPYFDSRVFQIPTRTEVINYLIWRQQDATRNSISMVAQSLYSHKELHGKSNNEMQEMIFKKGINWNDIETYKKRGSVTKKRYFEKNDTTRSEWFSDEDIPIFTQDKKYLENLIPENV